MRRIALALVGWLVLVDATGNAFGNDQVAIRAATHPGYGRVVFEWPVPVAAKAELAGQQLRLRFERPFDGDLAGLPERLRGYVRDVAAGEATGEVVLLLEPDVQPKVSRFDRRLVVDLYRQTDGQPLVPVRTGQHGETLRIVFDWPHPVAFRVGQGAGYVAVEFDRPASFQTGPLIQALYPRVLDARAEADAERSRVVLRVPPDVVARGYTVGDDRVLLDLTAGGEPAPAAAPEPGAQPVAQPAAPEPPGTGQALAQASEPEPEPAEAPGTAEEPVEAAEAGREVAEPPEIWSLAEQGGVLTRRGMLIIEPSFEYAKSTSNRLNFRGVSIAEGILIGLIEASDADRDTLVGALTGRYGVTDRLEVEVKVPYVYRRDRVTNTVMVEGEERSRTDTLDGSGLGDVEAALHYQINGGSLNGPFLIANLRFKSTTGEGPFEIDRDEDGIETELATGSGFYGLEPSLTAIYVSDPAVLFGSIGYLWNIKDSVDRQFGDVFIGDVDPGDSIALSFGLGLGLNEDLSVSLGFKVDFVGRTTTEINGVEEDSDSLTVGSFFVGGAYNLNPWLGVNLTTEIGATEDAPDARIILRMPVRLDLLGPGGLLRSGEGQRNT